MCVYSHVVCCARRSKQSEYDCERDKLVALQRELERKLLELEAESQCQHDQLMGEFDQVRNRGVLAMTTSRSVDVLYVSMRESLVRVRGRGKPVYHQKCCYSTER